MADDKRPPLDDDDIASLYLRRTRGGGQGAADSTAPSPHMAPAENASPAPIRSPAPPMPEPPSVAASSLPQPSQTTNAPETVSPVVPAEPQTSDQPRKRRHFTPDDDEALPLGAPVVFNAATQVQGSTVQPGALPIYFATDGLTMLREGEFNQAAEYYQREAQKDATRAEGWLGIGAALYGVGDYKQAMPYLNKGAEIDTVFPIGALLAETVPGKPDIMFGMGELFMTGGDTTSFHNATKVFEELMRAPTTSASMYARCDELKRKCRDKIDEILYNNPKLNEMKRQAARRKTTDAIKRFLFTVVLLGGLGFGGWKGYYIAQYYRYTRMGMVDYLDAYRLQNYGQASVNAQKAGNDPYVLYHNSYDDFHAATEFRPTDVHAHFMTVRCGEAILNLANEGKLKQNVSPNVLGQIDEGVRSSKEALKKLDAGGTKVRQEQTQLGQYTQRE